MKKKRNSVFIVDNGMEDVFDIFRQLEDEFDTHVSESDDDLFESILKTKPDAVLIGVPNFTDEKCSICKELQRNKGVRHIPVIVLSAVANFQASRACFDAGVADYMARPFNIEMLRLRLKNRIAAKKKYEVLSEEKHLLEEQIQERTFELEGALNKMELFSLEAVLRLSKAAEYRDDDTGNHVFRVGLYSAEIARALGMSDDCVKKILWAAPMHDVGKIGIPDNILLKQGPLSPQEWELMKTHASIGAKILDKSFSDVIQVAQILAYGHHEKWNGKGYPEGLEGEEIPLGCRVVAIADVFDALTTERPYKRAFPVEESFKIILEEKGKHFDPAVVDAFFSIQDTILDIREKASDIRKMDGYLFWELNARK
ncbi:MAG: HD domain-containing phosphohydrolase [bacterium]